jgi:hypothetical protein
VAANVETQDSLMGWEKDRLTTTKVISRREALKMKGEANLADTRGSSGAINDGACAGIAGDPDRELFRAL